MDFRIADTFTDSLARLTRDEQKAAKITAFDLQSDPSSPGLQFHRIDKSRDRNFWSLRVDRDLRMIVHRTAGSLLLCYVNHHDKAYAWAERRRIEAHPRTGTIQIVEVREFVEEVAVPSDIAFVTQPLKEVAVATSTHPFRDLDEARIAQLGVPADWLASVRTATEDEFLNLATHLPPEAAEALLEFAATGTFPTPEVVAPQLELRLPRDAEAFEYISQRGVEQPTLDFSASADTQRRFRTIENVEELEAALAFPWEKWSVFLHPSQREIIERRYTGPARVVGSAGTGKTVVALHRAARLATSDVKARVLLTTFSRPLSNSLQAKLVVLLGAGSPALSLINVTPFRGIAEELFELAFGRRPAIASDDLVKSALTSAAKELDAGDVPERFLLSEWTNVVDAWQLDSESAYGDVMRLGRKNRLGSKQRARLWPIFAAAQLFLQDRGACTWAQVSAEVSSHYAGRADKPFNHIVVDEAQDLGVPELRLLAAISTSADDALFFAGDLGQRIFQQPFSWRTLGIDVRGRSQTLKVNYRTSHQIREAADRLLSRLVRDADGLEHDRRGTVSAFNGPSPQIERPATPEAEATAVARFITEAIADGIAPSEVGVFVRGRNELPRARKAIQMAGRQSLELSERVEEAGDRISVGTMHLAKGLEFRAVAVMACDDEILPLQSRVESAADEVELDDVYETERQLLYVACTRARERLFVSGVAPGSEFLGDIDGGTSEIIPEFRDDPTSEVHGAYIAYFDVLLWIADTIGGIDGPDDEWDIAEKAMRTLLEAGELVAYGYRTKKKETKLKHIPRGEWPSLLVDVLSGQPEWDREKHGGREYGEALRRDPADGARFGSAVWTGVCFLKKDVLRHWPKPAAWGIPAATAARESAAIAALTEYFRRPENAKLTFEEARQFLESKELGISARGLETRVLPRARVAAGLPKNRASGRPSKAASN